LGKNKETMIIFSASKLTVKDLTLQSIFKRPFSKGRKPGLLVNFGYFHAPGSGSGSAFPIRIRICIQDSQINADPDPQHCLDLLKESEFKTAKPMKISLKCPRNSKSKDNFFIFKKKQKIYFVAEKVTYS
jgi:hypothetical protein